MCRVYKLDVSAANVCVPTDTKIQVVEMPVICAPLKWPEVPAHLLQSLSHLLLAKDCSSLDSLLHIDSVIGHGLYCSLVRPGLVRGLDTLTAMETPFGLVLSGLVGRDPTGLGVGCQLLLMTSPAPSVHEVWSQHDFDHSDVRLDCNGDDDAMLMACIKSIQDDVFG